jgi:long-subunit fatty acid transport protein
MRKTLLSVMAVMAIGAAAQAQEMEIGVKAGVNLATYGGDIEDRESRTGAHVGVLAEFGLSENFAIQPEIVFSMQGADRKYTLDGVTYETEQRLNYINIPIAAKYYVTEGLSIEAGPQIGFLISAKGDTDINGPGISESESVDNKDAFKTFDFGVFGGLGYELDMGLFFQARYTAGLIDILEKSDIDGDGDEGDYKITNNVFSISIGYKF